MQKSLKSDLAKAKGLGSAHSGVHHWWRQRFSSVILLAVSSWLGYFCWFIKRQEVSEIITLLATPYHAAIFALIFITSFYHALLGMEVIIDDYLKCRIMRIILLSGMKIFTLITVILFVSAIFKILILSRY